ncbi:MAG: hypothetical protein HY283_02725 [Nitrospirae bacterium]|nr:hypothetical protein [Nitrospirota bacterium]
MASPTWAKPGANAPIARYEAQGLAVEGKLYVFGGFYNQKTQATDQSDRYDIKTDTWTPISSLPDKITHAGQATDGRFIYLAGGFVGDHPGASSNRFWKYEIARNAWTEGPPLPAKRGGGALVRLERRLHYFGGTVRLLGGDYKEDHGDHWIFDLDHPDVGWSTAAPLPNPRNHIGGCAAGGNIYAVGGQHLGDENSGNQRSVDVYDPGHDTWSRAADLPIAKGHLTANVLERDGRIIVISGVTDRSQKLATIDEYDPETDTWTALTSLPEPRQSPVSGIVGDKLIVTGGSLSVTTWIGALSHSQSR